MTGTSHEISRKWRAKIFVCDVNAHIFDCVGPDGWLDIEVWTGRCYPCSSIAWNSRAKSCTGFPFISSLPFDSERGTTNSRHSESLGVNLVRQTFWWVRAISWYLIWPTSDKTLPFYPQLWIFRKSSSPTHPWCVACIDGIMRFLLQNLTFPRVVLKQSKSAKLSRTVTNSFPVVQHPHCSIFQQPLCYWHKIWTRQ